jgi:hypothetical protein
MYTFTAVIDKLRDGHGYRFGHDALKGHFYKAPYPEQKHHTDRDGALSAITFWLNNERATPTLMLYDFDDRVWWCKRAESPTD